MSKLKEDKMGTLFEEIFYDRDHDVDNDSVEDLAFKHSLCDLIEKSLKAGAIDVEGTLDYMRLNMRNIKWILEDAEKAKQAAHNIDNG